MQNGGANLEAVGIRKQLINELGMSFMTSLLVKQFLDVNLEELTLAKAVRRRTGKLFWASGAGVHDCISPVQLLALSPQTS